MSEQIKAMLEPADLDEMFARIKATRWPPVIGEDDCVYGTPQSWLKEMTDYWLNEWDWHSVAADMNRWSHHLTEIDGIKIHYLHAPARDKSARPSS